MKDAAPRPHPRRRPARPRPHPAGLAGRGVRRPTAHLRGPRRTREQARQRPRLRRSGPGRSAAVAGPELPPSPRGLVGGGQARGGVLPRQLAPECGRVRLRDRRLRPGRRLLPGIRDRRHPAPGATRERVPGAVDRPRRRGCRRLRGLPGRRGRARSRRGRRRAGRRAHDVHRRLHREPQRRLAVEPGAGAPGILDRPDPGSGLRLRVPQLWAAVPCGHVHDHPRHLSGGWRQRLHAPGRRRGAVPAHRRGALHRRLHHAAHHGPDRRTQRGGPLRPPDPAGLCRQARSGRR